MTVQPYHWLIFGVILMIAEMFVPTFFLLWLGAGAVVVAGLSWAIGLSFAVSLVLWAVISVGFCVAWFKFIQPKLAQNRTKAGLGASVIIGEMGLVIKAMTGENAGVIRFNTPKAGASEWAYRSQEPLAVGDNAVVLDVVGNELLIGKKV